MIGDLFHEAYLVRGVDGHAHVSRASQTLEANGDIFGDPAKIAQFAVYLPLLAATLRPSIDDVRVLLLRFTKRTFCAVFLRDGFIAFSARPEASLRKLQLTAMKIARNVEHGSAGAAPVIARTPAPAASPPPAPTKQRTKLGIWD